MAPRFEKRDIIDIIKFGHLENLKQAILQGLIKVPDDLVNLDFRKDSALHIAARYGQVEIIQFLTTNLKIKERFIDNDGIEQETQKIWGFDAKIKNQDNETALDIAKEYGDRMSQLAAKSSRSINQAMMRFLQAAEMEPGALRDQALLMMREEKIPNTLLKKKEDIYIPLGSQYAYRGKDEQGNLKSEDILYNRIKKEVEEERKKTNSAKQAKAEEEKSPSTAISKSQAVNLKQHSAIQSNSAVSNGRF